MNRLLLFAWICLLLSYSVPAQDSLYTRKIIKFLTSEKCFGRGYLKNGIGNAEKYILTEIKSGKVLPLFSSSFTEPFKHPVNTFPGACEIKINGKLLVPGADYILDPSSRSAKGIYKLQKKDSVTYFNEAGKIIVRLKNKLTFGVSGEAAEFCGIELDRNKFTEPPANIELNVRNKFSKEFKSENIGCFIRGKLNSDSFIVFTAHYDHLGGMGKETYFPGANDNASGVSMVLNLIKYYRENTPLYNTAFVFFAGEEAGLLGSKYFVEHNGMDLHKIKFLVNLDLLGTGDEGIMVVNGAVYEKEFALLNNINSGKKFLKEIRKRGKAANSDHYWFSEAGVPCFFIYTLGGIKAYHDIYDIEKTLPLTEYADVFRLLTEFAAKL